MMAHSQLLLELFAGIGGMRVAAKEIGLKIGAIHPFEINPSALEAYCHHFNEESQHVSLPKQVVKDEGSSVPGWDPNASKTCKKIKLTTKRNRKPEKKTRARNLLGLTMQEWDKLSPDLLTMSPPCQPFTSRTKLESLDAPTSTWPPSRCAANTSWAAPNRAPIRQGLRLDTADPRTDSLQHVLALLQDVARPPSRILLENVKGFETSCARREVLQVLHARGYAVKEFLLCPSRLGVPNSRLRYYLLAALTPPSSGSTNEAEATSTNQEVSLTFPLCLCLPWVQNTEDASSTSTTKTCCQCGKTIAPKASTLLKKFHSKALREYNENGAIQNQNEAHHPAALEYSDITPTLAHYLHSVRVSSVASCDFCTNSPVEPSCPGLHQATHSRDSIRNCSETCPPKNVESAATDIDASVSVVVASPSMTDQSSKSLDGVPTPSETETPAGALSCDAYCRYRLKEKVLTKYGRLLDVVDDSSRRTCCFTKGYGRLVEGTGSVFNPCGKKALDKVFSRVGELDKCLEQQKDVPDSSLKPVPSVTVESGGCSADVTYLGAATDRDTKNSGRVSSPGSQPSLEGEPTQMNRTKSRDSDQPPPVASSFFVDEHTSSSTCPAEQASQERSRLLLSLGLRYFSPREALRLMGFPERFTFPDHLSCRQQQQLIGNSVNVLVVAVLMAALEQTPARER